MQSVLDRVVDCVASATRYPKQLLVPEADLENDLGIDSVKRVEIVAALADEFRLDLVTQERDPSIRTIAHVAAWVEALSAESSEPSEAPPPDSTNGAPASKVRTPSLPAEKPSIDGSAIVNGHERNGRFDVAEVIRPISPVGAERPTQWGSLHGRVAFVTGSGRSVGRTIARVLASRGATVIINSFHSRDEGEKTTAEIVANGGQAFHVWGSVANPEHVDNIFAQIEDRYGALDILVCNASDGRIGSFAELTPDDWDRAFRTNVSGHYQCAMRAARLMQPRGGGSIVTMSAVGAHRFIDGLGSQGVVKAAVETMTKYLACTLASYGVRTNCVCGGPVYGDLLSKFPAAHETQRHWEAMTPGGELSSPMDLARTISFLVSEEARGINGAVWQVDQGFSAIADGRPLQVPSQRTAISSSH